MITKKVQKIKFMMNGNRIFERDKEGSFRRLSQDRYLRLNVFLKSILIKYPVVLTAMSSLLKQFQP